MTDAKSGSESAYPSGSTWNNPSCWWVSCCLVFSFLCRFLCTTVCLFACIFGILSSIYEFQCPSGIFDVQFSISIFSGINADPRCHTIFQVFGYVVTCGSLLVTLTAIYLYLNTRLHIAMPKFRLEQKKKNAWIKVQDSLYKGVVNMIPPASTGVNGFKLPPIKKAMRKRFSSPNEIKHFDLPNNSDLEKDDLNKEIKADKIAPLGNSYTTNEMSNKSKTDLEFSMANGQ